MSNGSNVNEMSRWCATFIWHINCNTRRKKNDKMCYDCLCSVVASTLRESNTSFDNIHQRPTLLIFTEVNAIADIF